MNRKLLSSFAVAAALTGSASAASYFQDFTFADGTTDLGDGTTIGSVEGVTPSNVNQVLGNQLRMTSAATGSTRSSFRIPALANSSLGWTATFDLTLTDAVGGNPPADGFTFNYGAIPALTTNDAAPTGHGAAEVGMLTGNEIAFQVDTWRNGDANSPGVGILQNGTNIAGGRIDGTVLPNDTTLSATVSITWDPATATYITNGLNTDANFIALPHTFTGDDSYSWAFSARTGGATEDLIIDNLRIVTVPEPSGVALLGLALGGFVLRRRRR